MRIIGGDLGGRRLKSAESPGLRPTTDRVRESIFNIIASRLDFESVRVLDLFAGTGALGIEALSRGAEFCTFVERERKAVGLIVANLADLGIADRADVVRGDALLFIGKIHGAYDLVMADPPYAAQFFDRLLDGVVIGGILAPGGLLVLEHPAAIQPKVPSGLTTVVKRTFGETGLLVCSHTLR